MEKERAGIATEIPASAASVLKERLYAVPGIAMSSARILCFFLTPAAPFVQVGKQKYIFHHISSHKIVDIHFSFVLFSR